MGEKKPSRKVRYDHQKVAEMSQKATKLARAFKKLADAMAAEPSIELTGEGSKFFDKEIDRAINLAKNLIGNFMVDSDSDVELANHAD